jgi:uncharacterized protein (TIGR00297 family)
VKLTASEWRRKAIRAGTGVFALTLRWLDWREAALAAFAALLFNVFVLPRFGRGIYREGARRWDVGIVAYPASVLVLLLVFRGRYLPIAASIWAMMAFGDPAASIFGRLVGGPRLPWNRSKTWIGLFADWAFAAAASVAVFRFVAARELTLESVALLVGGSGLFALLESLAAGIDDNFEAAPPVGFFLAWICLADPAATPRDVPGVGLALAVNAAVGVAAYFAGAVAISGALAGALVGTAILAAGGWPPYAVLWGFFLAGTIASKIGYREKERRGTAQAKKGRRGAEHVAANCLVAAAIAALSGYQRQWGLVFASCFAAALADTLATEFGSLYGKRPRSPLSGTPLPVGAAGAVSGPGLAAAALGAAAIGGVGAATGLLPPAAVGIVAVAGFTGAGGGVANDLGRRFGFRLDHELANGLNTFVGALVAVRSPRAWRRGRCICQSRGMIG